MRVATRCPIEDLTEDPLGDQRLLAQSCERASGVVTFLVPPQRHRRRTTRADGTHELRNQLIQIERPTKPFASAESGT